MSFYTNPLYLQITKDFAENPVYLIIVTTACRMLVAITTIIDEYFLELRNMFSNQESIRKIYLKRANSSHGYGCYCHTQPPMSITCSLYAHCRLTVCSLNVHYMFAVCSLHIHTVCSQYVHYMFPVCSLHTPFSCNGR